MSETIDLKEIEKKMWKSTFVDGIFEIYFGILFLSLALGIILDDIIPEPFSTITYLSLIGFGLMFFLVAKKYISQPRIGRVKFGRPRIMRKIKTIVLLTVNSIFLLIIFLIGFLNPQFRLMIPAYFYGLIVGLLFMTLPLCFVAYFLQSKRLYVIAILTGVSFFLEEIFALLMVPEPLDSFLSFGIISVIILCMGIVVFIRFLKEYPLSKEDQA